MNRLKRLAVSAAQIPVLIFMVLTAPIWMIGLLVMATRMDQIHGIDINDVDVEPTPKGLAL